MQGGNDEDRDSRIGKALDFAADVPLAIAEAGAEVSSLAAFVSENGDPDVQGDAVAAALLAEAGVQAAANLVEINLATTNRDPRIQRARKVAASASEAARRATFEPR